MKRILAAVDGSDVSSLVLARAVEVARATGGKIRLIHAVSIPAPVSPPGMVLPIETDSLIASGAAVIRGATDRIPEELRDGAVVELGNAADAVCTAARSYGADLVVVGAHKYGILSRVLGTTAARIVDSIDRPVLVVRPMAPATTEVERYSRPGELLRHDHEQLEAVYASLIKAYRDGDWGDVRAQWDTFDLALRAHMQTEETDVFPAFRAVNAKTAAELLSEHEELRKNLGALGVRIDLHSLTLTDAESLIDRVRAHAAREEELLYPWVDESLSVGAVHGLSSAA